MSLIVNTVDTRIAARIRAERTAREWSLDELARRSGVSKSMLSKIERAQCSATAALLGKLTGAFEISMAALFTDEQNAHQSIRRADARVWWEDKSAGLKRANLTPNSQSKMQIVVAQLAPRARIAYPARSYLGIAHQIVVLEGELTYIEGTTVHRLGEGDCLELNLAQPQDGVFHNASRAKCKYLVATSNATHR